MKGDFLVLWLAALSSPSTNKLIAHSPVPNSQKRNIFCLLIGVVLFTMPARKRTTVMRNILFWLLMLVVFLALAGC
jgi:hypothetical protein